MFSCNQEKIVEEDLNGFDAQDETILLQPLPEHKDHSRTIFRTANIRTGYSSVKVQASYESSPGTWTTLHPGQAYITISTYGADISLSWGNTACNVRQLRIFPLLLNNGGCRDMIASVEGDFYYPCQYPANPYIDIDTYRWAPGNNYYLRFKNEDGVCMDENYIQPGHAQGGSRCYVYPANPPDC